MVHDKIRSDLRRDPGIVAGALWPTASNRPSARVVRGLATDLESICDLFEHEAEVYRDSATAAAVFKDLRDITDLAVALRGKLAGLHADSREILETFGGFPAAPEKTGFRWFMVEKPRTRKLDGIPNRKFATPERSRETLLQLISTLERLDESSQRAQGNFKEQFGFGKGRNRLKISQTADRSPLKLVVYFASFLLIKYRPDTNFSASANGPLHSIAMALYEYLTGDEADAAGAPDLLRFIKQSIKYFRVARQRSFDEDFHHPGDIRNSINQYWDSILLDYYRYPSARIARGAISVLQGKPAPQVDPSHLPANTGKILEKLRYDRKQLNAAARLAKRAEGPVLG
ncbi:MAG: hypothetical protein J0H82_29295 [Alphaproteobacteria bacterium]|nr:hypothetical protein [Alphaproteobacteria bacterium]